MTIWAPKELAQSGPIYVAIADALEGDIDAGRLTLGTRLPTHRDLARSLGVNVVTVTRAYAEAARRGLVEGEVGRGTFVRARAPRGNPTMALRTEHGLVDLQFNLPAGTPPTDAVAGIFRALAKEGYDPLSAEYDPAGCPEHRAAGVAWMARGGLNADPERVFVVSGGQHAMAVCFGALCDPGDVVLTEELTYPGMKALATLFHLRLVPVALDAQGLSAEALDHACRKHGARVLYCMPTLHNPTGRVWSEERRRDVAAVARRHGLSIVEDTTGYLENPPTPLAVLAPECVYHVSSTSKTLGAGLRVGFVLLPASEGTAVRERFATAAAAIHWMTPPLTAEIVRRLIESSDAERIVAARAAETLARRDLLRERLGDPPTLSDVRCPFVWLPLPEPWRCDDFVSEARRAGVAVAGSEAFTIGRAEAPHAVRLALSTPRERSDVERALDLLATILRRPRRGVRALV
jgi:DNA-binding transcriptional MocR family regulator